MSKIDSGGYVNPQRTPFKDLTGGITRRDLGAIEIVAGMVKGLLECKISQEDREVAMISRLAYKLADALIAEGRKGEE